MGSFCLLEVANSLILWAVQLLAAQVLLNLLILFSIAQLSGDLARVTTGIGSVGSLGSLALRSAFAAVSGEHVLVVATQGVVVQFIIIEGEVVAGRGGGGHC